MVLVFQAGDENKGKTNPLRDAPNAQDQDSGLGYMEGGGQNEEEWEHEAGGEGEDSERRRGLGGSGDLRIRDQPRFRSNTVTSDDEWSDSGMHGISHGECERFQKVLEEKWQLYSGSNNKHDELGREAPAGAETGIKLEQKVEQRKSGGRRKYKSGEASGQGQDTMEHQRDLQTCPTSNERRCRISSKSCHQTRAVGPDQCDPSIVEASLPDPPWGCDDAREGAGSEQQQKEQRCGQDLWPDSGQKQGSDSAGQGWLYIPRRARHYRSYMELVQQRVAVECSPDPSDRSVAIGGSLASKKQTRQRLLRQRAARIGEQRAGLSSGDNDNDDALSEVKMGRHWSRGDRQRQWAQARDKRQRKEEEVVSERVQAAAAAGGETRAGQSIIELSQGLASRRRNKKVFDNWVTIQELLAHGSRAADGKMVYSPLLSVTTV